MIQANELRIGNIVMSKINGISKVEQIGSSINPEYVGGRSLEGNYWENSYLPIPLTEEILLKIGFVKDTETSYRWYLGEYFTYDLDDGGFRFEGIWINPIVKYLHQLQNLYFALTNQELVIKL